jgi:hypothetical protein
MDCKVIPLWHVKLGNFERKIAQNKYMNFFFPQIVACFIDNDKNATCFHTIHWSKLQINDHTSNNFANTIYFYFLQQIFIFCLHEWITNMIVGGGIEQWKVPLIIAHFVGKIKDMVSVTICWYMKNMLMDHARSKHSW